MYLYGHLMRHYLSSNAAIIIWSLYKYSCTSWVLHSLKDCSVHYVQTCQVGMGVYRLPWSETLN